MVDYLKSDALIEGDYRYWLYREWEDEFVLPATCVFIMLNPSKADGKKDDPSVRKCVGFARRWGFGKLMIVNEFAYRATNPDELKKVKDPIGRFNDVYIRQALQDVGGAVCAWGGKGGYLGQDSKVLSILDSSSVDPYIIGPNNKPNHPLYLPYDSQLRRWKTPL